MPTIADTIDALAPEIARLRHELHEHPEIRFEEQWTADRVARFLEEAQVPFTRGHAKGTGIVAQLEGKPGRAVALRADMDALEIQEATGLPYASRIPNRMHACGHDGHTACLCGVAKALKQHSNLLQGRVKFIFQPAEEIAGGGRYIVQEGHLDDVQSAFALHAWPALPAGRAAVLPGLVMASSDTFQILITGKGGHAADPGALVDPVLVAAHIITALQSIVSREIDPWEAAVLSVTQVEAGFASNVIPETATLTGTFRALQPRLRQHLLEAIPRVAQATASAFRARAAFSQRDTAYPPLHNDPAMSEFAQASIARSLGEENLSTPEHPYMTAEDFAFYLQKLPGAYIFLGNDAPGETDPPPLHSPHFNFNDASIPTAMRILANIAIDFLKAP